MQSFLGRSHQAVEQGNVQAMQVLQRVQYAELRPQIQMKSGMADRGEVHQNDIAMALLQGNCSVHRSRGAARATLRTEKREYARFSGTPGGPGARGIEAVQ